MADTHHGPLSGIRVLELGQIVAGPWAGALLAYFGAEVIKVESPSGDPLRSWRVLDEEGTSYWWRTVARNKRCVTLDLRQPEGRAVARSLAETSDVLIENFRPGTMERWGLGPETFKSTHKGLIYCRVSGYGQTGPYAERPGYASVAEAVGGLRALTGFPGEQTVRPNLSLGDTLAGLHAALGVLVAICERDRPGGSGLGQVVDVALYEAVFSTLEAVMVEHAATGAVRQASGATITGIVPSNIYPCRHDKGVMVAANGDSMFVRLMRAIDRPDLAEDEQLANNRGRVARQVELDEAIASWTATRTVGEVVDVLVDASVPCGPINDAADMRADPHFNARQLYPLVGPPGQEVMLPRLSPRLSRTDGESRWPGRGLGVDTDSVLRDVLKMDPDAIAALRRTGVLGALP